jgi:hypothetical protein
MLSDWGKEDVLGIGLYGWNDNRRTIFLLAGGNHRA